MAFKWISSPIASVLSVIAIGLALANWNAKPAAAWAWAAVILISVVMVVVQRLSELARSRSSGNTASVRSADSIAGAVAFGALMMIIPLALTLARAYGYGVVDDLDSGIRRTTMIMIGAYLAMTGNAMPRMLPPTSSMPYGGARLQAFQRFAGWTWSLCGLGIAMAWLALPIGAATPVSVALVATAMIVTIVQLLRLRKPPTLRA